VKCKYAPGDLLWVRETHWVHGAWKTYVNDKWQIRRRFYDFTAPDTPVLFSEPKDKTVAYVMRPSIFLKRKYARIFLEVTNVRIERLQDITEEDAEREGVNQQCCLGPNGVIEFKRSFKNGFHILWNTINTKRGDGWDENPWVSVIEFRRVK